MDKKEVRFGIVGIGKQGTFYTKIFTKLKWLVKGARLTAVCDILPERRKYAEENLPGVKVFEDYKEMFASGLVDAVMIETPHYFHPVIAIDAMRAGLNVLSFNAGLLVGVRELSYLAGDFGYQGPAGLRKITDTGCSFIYVVNLPGAAASSRWTLTGK